MGPPGDKKKSSQVVSDSPEETSENELIPPTYSEENLILQLPEPSTSTMTILSQLPQLEIPAFALPTILPPQPVKQEHLEETTLSNLEQAHIEDYFNQSKIYASIPEELIQDLPTPTLSELPDILVLGEPGPSGLQTLSGKPDLSPSKAGSKKVKKVPSLSKRSFTCEICKKVFPNAAKLSKHEVIHSASSPFKCEECKKTFSTKFKLVRHVQIHSDRKPFSCSACDRTFHRKDHLKNHVKVHSPKKTYYVCKKPDCKKEYTSHLSYKKHIALHAAEEGSLECQICLKTFETKEEILYHLKIHAGSRTVKNPNEKKFTCDRCDRKFFTRKDVRRHMVVHTGMRDFLCQFCPQRFGRKDHLVRHIKKSHSKNLPATQSSETVKQEDESDSQQGSLSKSFSSHEEHLEATQLKLEKSISSDSEPFGVPSYLDTLDFGSLPILEPQASETLGFLPETSGVDELKDLGSEVLKDIGEPSTSGEFIAADLLPSDPSLAETILPENIVINDPDLIGLYATRENLPLPPFGQTFQSPPPPPPK